MTLLSKKSNSRMRLRTSLFAIVALTTPGIVLAQSPAPDFVASPDLYKVVAQNEKFLVV